MSSPDIKIQFVSGAEPLLAYAKVPLTLFNREHLYVELKVLAGENGPWVTLPRRKEGDSWIPVIQIPEDIFWKVKQAVLLAYSTGKISRSKKTSGTKASVTEEDKSQPDSSSDINWTQHEPISIEGLSIEEILKLQPKPKIHLADRNKRIDFLERKYGKTFKGKLIKYLTNRQLYAISKSCGYR